MEKIITYTYGQAEGTPGPAAFAVYVSNESGELEQAVKREIGNATSDFAEYNAVMAGLQTLIDMYGVDTQTRQFAIKLSSDKVAQQLSGTLPIKEPGLVPMFIEIHNLKVGNFPQLEFIRVDKTNNKAVDLLAAEDLAVK